MNIFFVPCYYNSKETLLITIPIITKLPLFYFLLIYQPNLTNFILCYQAESLAYKNFKFL